MPPPRSIKGSIGSRIRLIFGASGSDWLLLLNADDGNCEWQTHFWTSIPHGLANQLGNCTNKGRYATEVAFGPTGSWYVSGIKRDGTGEHSWWGGTQNGSDIKDYKHTGKVSFGSDYNGYETCALISGRNWYLLNNVDQDLTSRIKRVGGHDGVIKVVRLFGNGGYFISDDEGTEWKNVGTHCSHELKNGGVIEEVAVAGDGQWVVIHPDAFVASAGVSSKLQEHLTQFYKDQRARNQQHRQEIREYHARVQREAREAADREQAERDRAEREAREQAMREQAERERAEREAREQAMREQAERERTEREAREAEERCRAEQERAEREARQAEERERDAAAATKALVTELSVEAKSLQLLEERLNSRKRAFHVSMATLPPTQRARVDTFGGLDAATSNCVSSSMSECVVCQDREVQCAVVPCGHHCLCDECANHVLSVWPRQCPLCRGNVESTLKIFNR